MRYLPALVMALALFISIPAEAQAPLSPTQIQRVVRNKIQPIQRCYSAHLSRVAPAVQASGSRVEVRIHVRRNGRVRAVDIVRSTAAPQLERCIRQQLVTMRFPNAKRETSFTYPLIFAPTR